LTANFFSLLLLGQLFDLLLLFEFDDDPRLSAVKNHNVGISLGGAGVEAQEAAVHLKPSFFAIISEEVVEVSSHLKLQITFV
jgi:hypothetical protein